MGPENIGTLTIEGSAESLPLTNIQTVPENSGVTRVFAGMNGSVRQFLVDRNSLAVIQSYRSHQDHLTLRPKAAVEGQETHYDIAG